MKKLLIVESPTKARTIGRILGSKYNILASMGHIRDLPADRLGIDVNRDFEPEYVATPRSRNVIRDLSKAVRDCDEVFLASDPDREGEAIAWHLQNVLSPLTENVPFRRVTFHEITRRAIEEAMQHPGSIDRNLVDAQQARRVLDRIVGYQVSPLLWRKLEKGSSAGRVQSVALRLVVEREREIQNFKKEEYWNFVGTFSGEGSKFDAKLVKIDGADFKVVNSAEAERLTASVKEGAAPQVASVRRQNKKRHPYPPFTTSTLQQAANIVLHYSASSTMRYAQQLYEGVELGRAGSTGLITYMRTDSVTIAKEAQFSALEFIRANFGADYAPEKPNYYKNKAAAQEAHEAIRPTDVTRTPESVRPFLDAAQYNLYSLIWKRFVASQMADARLEQTGIDVETVGADRRDFLFSAGVSVTTFPGFTKLYDDEEKQGKQEDNARMAAFFAALKPGMPLKLENLAAQQKFTEPPPRYSEASLIKALESNNIGRPSTYATILRTIQDRKYVTRKDGKLQPETLGFEVWDFLNQRLPKLFEIGFTADMEDQLDSIESGSLEWTKMMHRFYDSFVPWVTAAKEVGRPAEEDARGVLELLKGTAFEPAHKVGRRKYDDAEFYRSLADGFASSGYLSAGQFDSLLDMAARYQSVIAPEKWSVLPEALRQTISERARSRSEKQAADAAALSEQGEYDQVFKAFDKVAFAAPVTRGKVTFDDKKFFTSLKKQSEAGRPLSDKQLAALQKLVERYSSQLPEINRIREILKSPDAAAKAAAAPAVAVDPATVRKLLNFLGGITKWQVPVKRGRYTFDDKKFFQSLNKQFNDGKVLSEKQLAALQKLADKYKTE